MSISTLESPASRRALDDLDAEAARRLSAFNSLEAEVKAAFGRADASAIAGFAGTTTDYTNHLRGGGYGKRLQTVCDVITDALDHGDFTQRATQILLNAAAGKASQRDAQQLLEELAVRWADNHADDYS